MCSKNHDLTIQFLSHIKDHTREYGVKFIITKSKELNIGYGVGRASGYFNGKIIKVAGNMSPFIRVVSTALHEYCHFLQFINNEDIWIKSFRHNLDEVLHDKNVTDAKIVKILEADKQLEIDAEKKAVILIKKWKLPIDVDDYIKEANAYIYFYVYMMKYRKWFKKTPGDMPSILDLMPSTFCRNYDKLPEEYEKLVNRYCIK